MFFLSGCTLIRVSLKQGKLFPISLQINVSLPSMWTKDMGSRITDSITLIPWAGLSVVMEQEAGWPSLPWEHWSERHKTQGGFFSRFPDCSPTSLAVLFRHTHCEVAHVNTHGRSPGKLTTGESFSKKAALVHDPNILHTHVQRERIIHHPLYPV